MAQSVSDTDGGIAYVDYSDAQALQLVAGKVKNADGKYVAPSTAGASLAVTEELGLLSDASASLLPQPVRRALPRRAAVRRAPVICWVLMVVRFLFE